MSSVSGTSSYSNRMLFFQHLMRLTLDHLYHFQSIISHLRRLENRHHDSLLQPNTGRAWNNFSLSSFNSFRTPSLFDME